MWKVFFYIKIKLNNLKGLEKDEIPKLVAYLGLSKTIIKDSGGDYNTTEEFCSLISLQVHL